jgi:hypothetical protein
MDALPSKQTWDDILISAADKQSMYTKVSGCSASRHLLAAVNHQEEDRHPASKASAADSELARPDGCMLPDLATLKQATFLSLSLLALLKHFL